MSSSLHPPRACDGDAAAVHKPGRHRLICIAAALSILGFAAGARSETPALIGHVARLEPFAAVENGRSVGMIIDIVGAAFDRAKVPFRFVPLPLDEMEAALAAGRIQALAFVGATRDKRATMDFSTAIVVTGGALFTRADRPAASLKDLASKTVVTPRAGPLASRLARLAPDVTVTVTTGYDESFEAVLAGKADAAALNLQGGIRLARAKYAGKFRLPAEPFISLPLAFAVARGKDADLLQKFDEQLAAMRADGSLAAAERRWLGE